MVWRPRGIYRLAIVGGILLVILLSLLVALVWQPHVPRSGRPGSPIEVHRAEPMDLETRVEQEDKARIEGLLDWHTPRFEERSEEREWMVLEQIAARGVDDAAVLDAMQQVPRHRFVPDRETRSAYADRPLPIGYGQTISQPYIVALMTELLEVKPGDKILEIGTGSGYQAAVLTELTPTVYTIEIIEALEEQAAQRLDTLNYNTVQTKIDDGYYGWEEEAPFDGIIVTCAAGHIPPPLLAQLARGGRMVIPVGPVYDVQYLVRVTKDEDGTIHSESLLPVRFVPMTGRAQERP